MIELTELSYDELEAFVREDLKEARFRTDQLWQWIWQKGVRDVAAMTNLARPLREKLASIATVTWPEVAEAAISSDGTYKLLLRLADGNLVETVLIPGLVRYTQCLSTQVGCVMGCTFCSTGRMGFTRDMTAGEICGQILVGREFLAQRGDKPLRNLVFMGMGEPLLNLDNVMKALRIMQSQSGLDFSWRRSTVSSVGFPKLLHTLGEARLALPAISLHAPTQELRARIMPKAAQVPLDELLAALDTFPMPTRERITYEYLLLGGVNDDIRHARELARLLSQRRCKVNLIAYNPPKGADAPYKSPTEEAVLAFQDLLHAKGMTATLRRSMGKDIGAACGQLKAEYVYDLGDDEDETEEAEA